jgi:hypothetical protein
MGPNYDEYSVYPICREASKVAAVDKGLRGEALDKKIRSMIIKALKDYHVIVDELSVKHFTQD